MTGLLVYLTHGPINDTRTQRVLTTLIPFFQRTVAASKEGVFVCNRNETTLHPHITQKKPPRIPANPLSSYWAGALSPFIGRFERPIFLVRDIPLALSALRLARRFKAPVYVDMAENYPAALAAWGWHHPVHILTRNAGMARVYERLIIKRLAGIAVVAEENRDRLVGQYGYPNDRIVTVYNAPVLSSFEREGWEPKPPDPCHLVFMGHLGPHRGLRHVLEALAATKREGKNITFDVFGGPESEIEQMKHRASKLGVSSQVLFHGPYSPPQIPAILSKPGFGIVPHIPSEHTNTTLPNKVFDFFAAGMPVISSATRPVERLLHEVGAGITYQGGDSTSLCEVLLNLELSCGSFQLWQRNGRRAFLSSYNWEAQSRGLVQMVTSDGPA